MVDLRVRLGPLELPNPVLVSAGTFGYGMEFRRAVRIERLGGVITKTITVAPRQGNPPPRLTETPAGMLNAVGLQNVGLEAFVQEKLPVLRDLPVPVIVSILGETVADVETLCRRLDAEDGIAAIELNLSCPNIQHRSGLRAQGSGQHVPPPRAQSPELRMVSQDPQATSDMVQAARQSTRKPLIAKLSPDVTDPRPIAEAAQRAGADILTLVNTFTGMSLDPKTRRSRLGSMTGGVSGPAIRPLAVYRVWLTRQAVDCPIIGVGGIVRAEHAIEFLLAGASAVAVGTATFANPRAAEGVVRGLERFAQRRGLASISQLVGALESTDAVAS